MALEKISIGEARRMALAAQGLDRPRPRRPGAADVAAVIRRLGLVQIDCVNVLLPAQYQVVFSRLGPYRRALFDDVVYRQRQFTEHWAHEASIVPMEARPLLSYRREQHRLWRSAFDDFRKKHPEYAAHVIEEVRARGPLTADDLGVPDGVERRMPGSWLRSIPRAALEGLFGRGDLAVAERRQNFARVYDLTERVVPEPHRGAVPEPEGRRELLRAAARACGVATAADLADYFRMKVNEAAPAIAELVEEGALERVEVEGWRTPAFRYAGARAPRAVRAAMLLSPFDPLIWFRPRGVRLFAFDHRFEIFVPEEKRLWGCYVLPFLLGERMAARVDLKTDRVRRRLLVLEAHLEDGHEAAAVAEALAGELRTMAQWLELEGVMVKRRGPFARLLAGAVKG